ncbi:ROK family protein [Anaeromyxobacter oryzae]|uniref:Polyphosphate glucokinase n=1 Tax=Anaeromyxobacter oryzae TaxID=2918170 RepID=A0ABN6N075_9BACT|nr:ROK family protein [Anaeromyxobacter oryzae]BDG05935.1 polyphosphate glucokinase [Anaeromyxobacter oryzae]
MARRARARGLLTLCVDIGGSGVKAMRVSTRGTPVSERVRVPTPRPATPAAVLGALRTLIAAEGPFDRVAVGFPGVVEGGVVRSAPNLHPSWAGVDLGARVERLTGRPVRVLNDAGMQGFGAVEGRGVEACVTLGTGMGFSLFVDGAYVPNIELGHHPLRGRRTYEQLVGAAALEQIGRKKWSRRVADVLDQVQATFNPRAIWVGGGNAKKLGVALPRNVHVVANVAGLLGGARAWDRLPAPAPRRGAARRRPETRRRRAAR